MVLYNTVYIYAVDCDDSLKSVATLATNSKKTALVRSLTVEYMYEKTKKNRRVTTYLSKSLVIAVCKKLVKTQINTILAHKLVRAISQESLVQFT